MMIVHVAIMWTLALIFLTGKECCSLSTGTGLQSHSGSSSRLAQIRLSLVDTALWNILPERSVF